MSAPMSETFKVAVLAGDGIGPEVMAEAMRVLGVVTQKFSISIEFNPSIRPMSIT